MSAARIKNIQDFIAYVEDNSTWETATIRNAISALGHHASSGYKSLMILSDELINCAEYGAASGFPGFTYYHETIQFFRKNRKDIVANLERAANETGMELVHMVQSFGVFRNETPPSSSEISKALWDSSKIHDELTALYNVFAWFVLEEIAHIWQGYLDDAGLTA